MVHLHNTYSLTPQIRGGYREENGTAGQEDTSPIYEVIKDGEIVPDEEDLTPELAEPLVGICVRFYWILCSIALGFRAWLCLRPLVLPLVRERCLGKGFSCSKQNYMRWEGFVSCPTLQRKTKTLNNSNGDDLCC